MEQQDPQRPFLADYLDRQTLAKEFRVSLRTLARYERQGLAPPSIRLGRYRLYRRAAVQAFLLAREHAGGRRKY